MCHEAKFYSSAQYSSSAIFAVAHFFQLFVLYCLLSAAYCDGFCFVVVIVVHMYNESNSLNNNAARGIVC